MATEVERKEKELFWQTPRGEVRATPDVPRNLFNCPSASNMELFNFVQLCMAHKLNPFLKEVYLIKYNSSEPA